jgi:hypothetical protein
MLLEDVTWQISEGERVGLFTIYRLKLRP